MTPDKARAIWAIYVWCRRTDELVDGPNAPRMTPAALDRWEERLAAVFAGRPYDVLDAALADTVARFPVDIVPFKDMVRKGGGRGGGGSNSVSRFCRRGGADAKTLKNLPVFSLVRRIWRRAHQANNRKPCRHTFTYHP